MSELNEPAFPWGEHGDQLGGMSLRDYFAAKAMTAILGVSPDEVPKPLLPEFFDTVARYSYQMADAMLKARAQPEAQEGER